MRHDVFSLATAGGSSELTLQLQQRINCTLQRQLAAGEPVCFRVFDDSREWLEEQNRCRYIFLIHILRHLR